MRLAPFSCKTIDHFLHSDAYDQTKTTRFLETDIAFNFFFVSSFTTEDLVDADGVAVRLYCSFPFKKV